MNRIKKGKCACVHRNYSIEDVKRYPNLNKNVEILDNKVVDSQTKIKCRCKVCGHEWKVTPNKLQQGKGCPICKLKTIGDKNSITNDEFLKRLKEVHPNLISLDGYHRYYDKIRVLCKKCGTESICVAGKLLRNDDGCHRCRSSIGEQNISDWLDENNILYKRQFMFDDCVFIDRLRFDFYLPKFNICIEYQGEQHYFPVNFRGKHYKDANKDFEYLQVRDNIKRNYCKEKGICLIEIPYWARDDIPTILSAKINVEKNP